MWLKSLAAAILSAVAELSKLFTQWRQRRDAQAALRERQLKQDLDAIKRAEKSNREVDSMSDADVADELRKLDRD